MNRRHLLTILPLLAFTVAVGTLGRPSAAFASCAINPTAGGSATAPGFATAPLVFVGTVTATSDGGRHAVVKVESIWYGPLLPTYVQVSGSPVSGNAATSVDRSYVAQQRYLFVLSSSSQPLMDNSCSSTQPYSPALAAQAPANARPPQPGGDELANQPLEYLRPGAVMLLVVGTGIAFWLWRRHSRLL